MRLTFVAALLGIGLACTPPPDADLPFSEGLVAAYTAFDDDPEVLAPLMRNLERQLYVNMRIDAGGVGDRTLQQQLLVEADVQALSPRPEGTDLSENLAVTAAFGSRFPVQAHATIPVLADQVPLEPQSPEHFDRQFLEGEDCWEDRDCEWLRTYQDLTKVYPLGFILPPITYAFFKDFRWLDLNAGLQDADGERWAVVSRSWNPDVYASEDGRTTMYQAYTFEIWLPRDGGGFLWTDANIDKYGEPADDQGDSSGGGTLRSLSLWNQTQVPVGGDKDTQLSVIPGGVQDNYNTHDQWLEEHWTK